MNKLLSLLVAVIFHCSLFAQSSGQYRQKVAVFAPLFLDSAYNGLQYKHGNSVPRYIIPGIEFYQGVQLALDSMQLEGVPLEVYIYDTKAKNKPLAALIRDLPKVELLIGAVGGDDLPILANAALERKIPFISATYPNDAGVKENPYLVILNSTLPVHLREIYSVLQKNHSLHQVVYFRRKSNQDDWLKDYFSNIATTATGIPVKIKYVDLDYGFTYDQVRPHLDSNTTNICLAGSMDETFNRQLAAALATQVKSHTIKLFGMPTWDGYKDLGKSEYKDLEINYTAPLYNPRTDKISLGITDLYKRKFYSRPSDMVFWGYGATWKFCRMLLEYGPDISSNLAVDKFDILTDLEIQPVLNPISQTLDYFENKKVFLITKLNGAVVAAK